MKTSIFTLTMILGLFLSIPQTQAQSEQADFDDFVGIWEYTSQDAPYAYQQGQLAVAKKNGKPSVRITFSNKSEVEAGRVKMDGGQLKFSLYIESEYIPVKLELKEEHKITGFADTSEGEIAFTADKEIKKDS